MCWSAGAPPSDLEALISGNTVSIGQLLPLLPPDSAITDPTPYLYSSSCYAMGELLCVAFLCNEAVRPVDRSEALDAAGQADGLSARHTGLLLSLSL